MICSRVDGLLLFNPPSATGGGRGEELKSLVKAWVAPGRVAELLLFSCRSWKGSEVAVLSDGVDDMFYAPTATGVGRGVELG